MKLQHSLSLVFEGKVTARDLKVALTPVPNDARIEYGIRTEARGYGMGEHNVHAVEITAHWETGTGGA